MYKILDFYEKIQQKYALKCYPPAATYSSTVDCICMRGVPINNEYNGCPPLQHAAAATTAAAAATAAAAVAAVAQPIVDARHKTWDIIIICTIKRHAPSPKGVCVCGSISDA